MTAMGREGCDFEEIAADIRRRKDRDEEYARLGVW